MQFNIKKPSHFFALLLILTTFFMIIVLPILSFFEVLPSTQTAEVREISESFKFVSEIIVLVFQLVMWLSLKFPFQVFQLQFFLPQQSFQIPFLLYFE